MKQLIRGAILALMFCSVPSIAQVASRPARISQTFNHLPLYFEKNAGQTAGEVQFISRGPGYRVFLTPTETVLDLRARIANSAQRKPALELLRPRAKASATYKRSVVRMKFLGAKSSTQVAGLDELEAKSNYFVGNDPKKWLSAVPTFAKVQYTGVYPGVNIVYYGNQGHLEYDLQLQPKADPKVIRIAFEGASRLSLAKSGDLLMETEVGSVVLQKPSVYQLMGSARKQIKCMYVLRNEHELGIRVSDYDRNKELVIDPALIFSSYISGTGDDEAYRGTIDAQGNSYVVGSTTTTDFPASRSTSFGTATTDGSPVIVVSKVDATGTNLIYTTYLSDGDNSSNPNPPSNAAFGVAVDGNGYAYITGYALSGSFPVTANAYQQTFPSGAPETAFVSKLSADGQSLLYSTFLGAAPDQGAYAIAVDANQVAYVGGSASPGGFPTTANAFQTTDRSSNGNAFISKIDTKLSGANSLVYSTFLGGSTGNGSNGEFLTNLALDGTGKVYAIGWTFCTDFPVTSSAYQSASKAQYHMVTGFFSVINTTLSGAAALVYSTYLGGSTPSNSSEVSDRVDGIALDPLGKVYVSGITGSADFPVTIGTAAVNGAFQGFLTKFDITKANATSVVYSRVFGNDFSFTTDGMSVAVDPSGNAYVGGFTLDPSYPVTADAVQSSLKSTGGGDGLLTIFSADAATVLYSTFFGADNTTDPNTSYTTGISGVALDSANNIYISGTASGIELPTTQQLFQSTVHGPTDFFVAKFGGISTPTITSLSAVSGVAGSSITISGVNFGSSGTVTFNGVAASTTSWAANSITATVPSGSKSGNVVVTAGGVVSNGVGFTVLAPIVPIVFVQGARLNAGNNTNASISFLSNNSQGNWIGVCVRAHGTNQNLSVSDSKGNLYRQALSVNDTGGGNTLAIFYAENVAAGPNTVTVSQATLVNLQIAILEYSGVALYASLDSSSTGTGNSTAASTGNITTTASGDLLLGVISAASATTITAGAGYQGEESVLTSPNATLLAEDQTLAQPGGASATATLASSLYWAAGLAAFKVGTATTSAPVITSISPVTGAGGTVVTIKGYNFGAIQGTSTIKFNTSAASPTAWSDSSITVKQPNGATDGYIVVTVGGVPTNGVWFPQPVVQGITPSTAAVGSSVTVTGGHFGTTTGIVRFNGTAATVSSWTSTQVIVTIPAGATTGPLVLANSSGILSNASNFTVSGSVPSVNSISPTSGSAGTTVTISGLNFGTSQGSSTVAFNGVLAGTATSWTPSSIKVSVPTGAITGNVLVTVGGNSDHQTAIFTVNGTPTVAAMTPSRGGVGAAVNITGSSLGSSGTITFNGVSASPWSWSPTLIVVPVPSGATSGTVAITVAGNQLTAGVFDVRSSIPATATEFSYDAVGRVIQKTICTPMDCGTEVAPRNLTVTYDLAGDETSVSFNGPIINYAIDSAGRVAQVTSTWNDAQHPATLTTVDPSNGYWPTGALRKMTLANGLTESTVYNTRVQPCRINVNSSGALLSTCSDALPSGNVQDFTGTYNAGTTDNGDVIGFTAAGQENFNRSYTFDSLNRIKTMSAPGDQCSGLSYTIDAWGNRTAQTGTGGTCYSSTANVATNNRLTAGPYQYDASGNLLNDGNHQYTYDGEGRLAKVDGGATATYVYDAFGQRVDKNVAGVDSEYIYDQNSTLNSVFNNGTFQRGYVYISGQPLAEYFESTTYFVHGDHLGSTRLLTRLDKTIRESDDYYPFGEFIASTGGTGDIHKFTGKERDSESGLDYFGARYDASSMGRFMTPDPLPWAHWQNGSKQERRRFLEFISNPQNFNMYSYVRNNPTTLTDPDGMDVYVVVYTTGNSEGDEQLKRAAQTKKDQITSSKGFDPKKDTVILAGVKTKEDFQNVLNSAAKIADQFGKTTNVSLFSHAGDISGPVFHDAAGHPTQFTQSEMSNLKVNWGANSTATFYGCRTANNFAQDFANAQNVRSFGFLGGVDFSGRPDSVSKWYLLNGQFDLFMVDKGEKGLQERDPE